MGLGKLEKRVGFIGAGQMAEALARGFISKGVVKASDMVATDPVAARRDVFESFSVKPVTSNAEVHTWPAMCRTHVQEGRRCSRVSKQRCT